MELDFDATEETTDYVTVPAATYLCEVRDVRAGQTRNGDPRLLIYPHAARAAFRCYDQSEPIPAGFFRHFNLLVARPDT